MTFSTHAKKRCQQRGVSPDLVLLLEVLGMEIEQKGNTYVLQLDKKTRRSLCKRLKTLLPVFREEETGVREARGEDPSVALRDQGFIAIGVVAEIVDLTAEQLDRTDFGRGRHVEHAAATLFDLVVIADHTDAKRAAIVEQQLAAGEPAIAVVDVVAIGAVGQEAVTLVDAAAHAEREGIADRTGDEALDDHCVVIAVAGFDHAAEVELRFLGDDRDHAGAGVLAEQGRLRAAQDLDARDQPGLDHVELSLPVGQRQRNAVQDHVCAADAERGPPAEAAHQHPLACGRVAAVRDPEPW